MTKARSDQWWNRSLNLYRTQQALESAGDYQRATRVKMIADKAHAQCCREIYGIKIKNVKTR